MKKIAFLLAVVLCTAGLMGCNDDPAEEKIPSVPTEETKFKLSGGLPNYLKEVGSYLTPEAEYVYDENGDNAQQINFRAITGMTTIWYQVDPVTGEVSPICPAEGCTHTRDSGCRYLDENLCPVPGTNALYYAAIFPQDGDQQYMSVLLLDSSANTAVSIYESQRQGLDTSIALWKLLPVGQSLFLETEFVKHDPESAQSNRERMLICLDMAGEALKENIIPMSSQSDFLYADGQYLYFSEWETRTLIATDLNGENRQVIWEYDENANLMGDVCYDENERMLYVGIQSYDELRTGYICRIDSELNAERMEMPSDLLLSFHFTDTYIYYTVYDPVRLGTDKGGGDCIEDNGAKIWRTRRNNTTQGELIFDSEQRLFFTDYQVSGDYLYLHHKHLMNSGKNVWFQASNAVMRVNFRENTMKWMNFFD